MKKPDYTEWIEKLPDDLANQINLATHLWDEYKYRHDLCWNLTFKLTIVIVTLSTIPYVNTEIVIFVCRWIIIAPILGVCYGVMGFFKLRGELKLLNHIRNLYRRLQNKMTIVFHEVDNKSGFSLYVSTYIFILNLLAIINVVLILFVWIPKVLSLYPTT